MLLNGVLLLGLLYKNFGESLASETGVTVSLMNHTAGPMLDVVFEYPGGKLELPEIEARGQVGHSIMKLSDFDATLSFKDEQGHSFKEIVTIGPYDGLLLLLSVQPVLETTVVKTADGKDETVIKASPDKVFVMKSYQKPGFGK